MAQVDAQLQPKFISTLYQPTDLLEIRKFQGRASKGSEWHLAKDLPAQYRRLKKENDNQVDIYFGLNPRKAPGGKSASDIASVRAVAADLDNNITEKDARSELAETGLPHPTFILRSGHGIHFYWSLISTKVSLEDWKKAQQSIIKAFAGAADDKIKDLPRIMRLPGFTNWKIPDKPVKAFLIETGTARFPIDAFLGKQVATQSPIERARKYLDRVPGATQGQGGDQATYIAACRLVKDFDLSDADALIVLTEWNQKCNPPWSDADLRKKIASARTSGTGRPGKLLGTGNDRRAPQFDHEALRALAEESYVLAGTTTVWHAGKGILYPIAALRLEYGEEAKAWTKCKNRKIISKEDLVFEPSGQTKPGQLNLFKKFNIDAQPGDYSAIVAHILHLCGGDENLTHWLTCWLAYPIQHPGAKLQTAIVLHGAPGVGKNLLFDAIVKLYSPYSITLSPQILEGRFTGWLSRKCFVLCDEAVSSANAHQTKNRLKSLITSETFAIEEKNLPVLTERNCANFAFLSNNEIPLLTDLGDRRFAVIRCDNVESPEYYCRVANRLDAPGGLESFRHYLATYPLEDWNCHTKPPVTNAKLALTELCQAPYDRFLDQWSAGDIPAVPFKTISRHLLYVCFRAWCESSGDKGFPVNETRFGREAGKRFQTYRTAGNRFWEIGSKYDQVTDISEYLSLVRQESAR